MSPNAKGTLVVTHGNTKVGLCIAACCLLALYIQDFSIAYQQKGRAVFVDHAPGDLPDVIIEAQRSLAPLPVNDSNPLYNDRNKGRIVLDFSGDPPHEGLWSKMANEADLNTTWTARNAELLHISTERYHRKTWELVYILEVVNSQQKCGPGSKGLVFAAGIEPLTSRFAQQGCSIHATDFPADVTDTSNAWVRTNQHASLGMYKDWFGSKEKFNERVSYEPLDMNFVEVSATIQLKSFDFMWSTCSVEHVGSVSLGKRFIMNAMSFLKPGGIAVHTMEFTISRVSSSSHRHGSTSLWTRDDVTDLARDLCWLGYEVMPLRFEAGTGYGDLNPDQPPYETSLVHPHVKLWLFDQVCTSFALVVRKPEQHQRGRQHECYQQNGGR